MVRTTIAASLAGALLVGGSPAATAQPSTPGLRQAPEATGYRDAVSAPKEDSYYPAKGDPRIDTLHYGLDLSWSPRSRTLTGTASIRFRATRATKHIQLDLGGPLRVSEVRLDGAPVHYRHPGKDLIVRTGRLAASSRHSLRVHYAGTPRPVRAPVSRSDIATVGWTTTSTGQVWTMQEPFGAYTWYPVNDHPSDKAFYDARISAPKRWVGIFNGELVDRRTTAHRTITRFHLDSPAASYLTTIAIGPYERMALRGPGGLPVVGWVEPGRDRQRRLVEQMPRLLRWLEARLGPYPFDRAGAVFVPSESAMETQTLVTMGTGQLSGGSGHARAVMLHELAHQWYGDSVTPRDWRDLWLNEGFATYLQFRWSATHGGSPMRFIVNYLRDNDQRYRNRYGPPGDYYRDEFASTNVYYCTALMLIELRAKIGKAAFADVLRAWPQQHRSSNQSRASYIAWLNDRTDRHLGHFVREWLMSPTTPS